MYLSDMVWVLGTPQGLSSLVMTSWYIMT